MNKQLFDQIPFYREMAKTWKRRGNQRMVDKIADGFKRMKLAEKRMAQTDATVSAG